MPKWHLCKRYILNARTFVQKQFYSQRTSQMLRNALSTRFKVFFRRSLSFRMSTTQRNTHKTLQLIFWYPKTLRFIFFRSSNPQNLRLFGFGWYAENLVCACVFLSCNYCIRRVLFKRLKSGVWRDKIRYESKRTTAGFHEPDAAVRIFVFFGYHFVMKLLHVGYKG